MHRDELVRRNHRLFSIFMRQAFRDPALVETVPDKADIILLPDSDPELLRDNLRLLKQAQDEGRHPIPIQIRLVPETHTILMPQVKILSSADLAGITATKAGR